MVGVQRPRVIAGIASVLALVGVSTWLFAAEDRGALPRGHYEASLVPDWPVTTSHAEEIRRDAFVRAAVRLNAAAPDDLPGPRRSTSSPYARGLSDDPLDRSPVTCRFLHDQPSGTSAKFDCVLDGGEVIKVKYGRNSEIHAEAAATHLLAALGFAADHVRIVPLVRCYGCPRFPFFTTQLLSLARVPDLLAPHGYDDAYTDFEWVAVEQKFPAPPIETDATQGWAWFELKASQAPRADLDAFRLVAVFLAHWDNKSVNQRLVCLDELPAAPDQRCSHPLLMMQDLGATFGPTKVNLAAWRDLPIWADRQGCIASMRALPYHGATFPDVRISEAGRMQLARQLSLLSSDAVRSLFTDARFPEYQSGTDDERDLQAWMGAFRHRVDQIVNAGPCA
jgi:hypothetical protein